MAVKPPDPTRQRNFYFINGKRGEKTNKTKKTQREHKNKIFLHILLFQKLFTFQYIIKKKKPEMDNFGSKGKILWKMSTFLMDTKVAKMPQNMSAYSFVSEQAKLLFIFWL